MYTKRINLLILFVISCQCHSSLISENIVRIDEANLQLLLLDDATHSVFAASINAIYKFDQDLNLLGEVTTGPVLDAFDCDPQNTNNCNNLQLLPNEPKVMLQNDAIPHTLIFCGSVRQGLCAYVDKHQFDELHYFPADNKYNFMGGLLSATALFSPEATVIDGEDVIPLFVAMEYDNRSLEFWPEMFTSRRVHYNANSGVMWMTLTHDNSEGRTALDLPLDRLLGNPVRQVTGFHYENYVYFVTVQPSRVTSSDLPKYFITRLVRFCRDDPTFTSMASLDMKTIFKIAVAAHLQKVTKALSTNYDYIDGRHGLNEGQTVLFIVFESDVDVFGAQSGSCPRRNLYKMISSSYAMYVFRSFKFLANGEDQAKVYRCAAGLLLK